MPEVEVRVRPGTLAWRQRLGKGLGKAWKGWKGWKGVAQPSDASRMQPFPLSPFPAQLLGPWLQSADHVIILTSPKSFCQSTHHVIYYCILYGPQMLPRMKPKSVEREQSYIADARLRKVTTPELYNNFSMSRTKISVLHSLLTSSGTVSLAILPYASLNSPPMHLRHCKEREVLDIGCSATLVVPQHWRRSSRSSRESRQHRSTAVSTVRASAL